jgi:predicted RNA-binding protein with PIN domain
MLYLIDGYNLLFRLKSKKQTLKDAREFLVNALGKLIKEFELKAKIVFDSSLDMAHLFPSKTEKPPLEIIFAPYGVSADDYLIEIISYQSKKIPITLVTSDQGLALQAKQWRIKTISIEELFDTFSVKAQAKSLEKEIHQKDLYEKAFSNLFDYFLEEFEKRLPKE